MKDSNANIGLIPLGDESTTVEVFKSLLRIGIVC